MQAMMQLGKLTNPVTNKTETEIEAAQVTIDMLDMLKSKSKGNLGDDESKFLDHVISDLKLNFVEEKNKISQSAQTSPENSKSDEKKDNADKQAKHEDDQKSEKEDSNNSAEPTEAKE